MKKLIALLLSLCAILFAESREMRIGDSQYFKTSQDDDQMVKVTLMGIQNGVAIVKKEPVAQLVSTIDYFYVAPNEMVVAPIEIQPYPAEVYSSDIEIRGIFQEGQSLLLYKAGENQLFSSAVPLTSPHFSVDGSNFAIKLPLEMGDNTYFISYGQGVVGNRAQINVNRVYAPASQLYVGLDPIGSADIRKTSVYISNASYGRLEGYESILGNRTVKTELDVVDNGTAYFSVNNTYNDVFERMLDILLFDYKDELVASNSITVPVSESIPECMMTVGSTNFTPSHSMSGSFKASEGVRFVWARVLDYRGVEISRAYIDIEKMPEGSFTIDYSNKSYLVLRVYDKNGSMIRERPLYLPFAKMDAGYEHFLELGVTNIAGNRSNTYKFNLFEAEFEKMLVIPLDNAIPTTDVSNYPVLVQLDNSVFDFSKALESGDDIFFTDLDGKKLNAEKEYFSRSNGVAKFWVKVPVVSAFSANIQLKICWGNPLAEPYNGYSVWSDAYKGVYHFDEEFRGPYVIPKRNYSNHVVYTTGSINIGERSVLNGAYKANGSDALVVEPLPVPGVRDAIVRSGSDVALAPGSYGNLFMENNCKLSLSTGTYHFKNISVGNDSKILVDVTAGVVAIKASGNISVNDRSSLIFDGKEDPSAVRIDVMGSEIHYGSDTKWNAILTAPNAKMTIFDRCEWNGALYVKELTLGMDVAINASISQDVYAYSPSKVDLFPPKSITGFALYAKKNLFVDGQSRITGSVGSEQNIILAEDSRIEGDMLAWGSVELRSQASLTGRAVVGGDVSADNNVNWNGNAVPLSRKNPMSIMEASAEIGTKQAFVQQGMTSVIEPGVYERLEVSDGATAVLLDGLYHFGSVVLRNRASMEMDADAYDAEIIVSNSFVADNNVKINSKNKLMAVRYAGTESIRFGNDCIVNSSFTAPHADFVLSDRSAMNGYVWAQNIALGHQVIFTNENVQFSNKVEVANVPYSSDWIADATVNANNGSVQMGYAEAGYIANNEYFGIDGSFILKNGNYFKNHEGTISAWVYFDGAEGKFMASSDDVVPDWSLERTLEGHVVFKAGSASMLFPVPEQSWAYLTFAVNGTRVDAYVNGEFVKSLTIAALDDIMTPWVGVTVDGLFKIDELRFMNKVLSKEWIRMDYVTQKLNKNEEGVGEYALAF